ncbi:MAG: methyltransferase domain-containing protein [Cytophagaceae bacterium]|nr:methyltransferase domain-containing protein [Cytophagaceae bacterium]MDW8457276.1 class I SAM-dependent methyltransferase [Cytophagaceae bacterium]
MNDRNIKFYENIPIDQLKILSLKGGFSSYIDLETISTYIQPQHTVLEIGAAYGRCLDYFIHHQHKGKIFALEKSYPFIEFLKKQYVHHTNIEVIHADILQSPLPVGIDTALWMWSGIVDFSKEEQMMACKRISQVLNYGGQLFIDIPRIGFQTIAKHNDEQHLHLKTQYGDIIAFIPSVQDIKTIQKDSHFSILHIINYETSTQKQRTIYRLVK